MSRAANEIHTEDGVGMYSVVRVYRGGVCGICFQDVPQTASIDRTEIHAPDGAARGCDALFICEGCVYRIGGMFGARNAGKELFNGILQDAAGGTE